MAVKTKHDPRPKTSPSRSRAKNKQRRELIVRYLPAWLIIAGILALMLPTLLSSLLGAVGRNIDRLPGMIVSAGGSVIETGADVVVDVAEAGIDVAGVVVGAGGDVIGALADAAGSLFDGGESGQIAPLFTREVSYWEDNIMVWADSYDLDPNLLATVMQIESCGHPTVTSSAGAQGLFQVMPFHFATGEDWHDPEINAGRGAGVLKECLRLADGDVGLAMACYNGGPSVLMQDMNLWMDESRRYYYWGQGIYDNARANSNSSPRLDEWLNAGGAILCDMAAGQLGID